MQHSHEQAGQSGRKHRHEGPRNHILSFVLSIVLTALAFLAAANTEFSKGFIYLFIMILAIVQVVIQLYFWMHMKDRGHQFPQLFLWAGAFVALTVVAAGVFWLWW
ncbi:cytochrome C oxidase subunit IV family protein [Paenibacillus turpanensis]|uniref:cytochrome C oxidase subunit IV family protein n=1 Tax=Paenibacillus turpanensis TaxID=2689078 RepID=UPI00140D7AC4|nr:cytochrome C oxidase subunit IV family protein [Paenibacillus turpanensis]